MQQAEAGSSKYAFLPLFLTDSWREEREEKWRQVVEPLLLRSFLPYYSYPFSPPFRHISSCSIQENVGGKNLKVPFSAAEAAAGKEEEEPQSRSQALSPSSSFLPPVSSPSCPVHGKNEILHYRHQRKEKTEEEEAVCLDDPPFPVGKLTRRRRRAAAQSMAAAARRPSCDETPTAEENTCGKWRGERARAYFVNGGGGWRKRGRKPGGGARGGGGGGGGGGRRRRLRFGE